MDGTLLNSQGLVSEENQRAIKEFVVNGGKFGIATGRSQLNSIDFLKDVELNIPCILYNGCLLYDFKTKKILKSYDLPKSDIVDFLKYCLDYYPQILIQVYTKDMCHIISSKDLADQEVVLDHKPCQFSRMEDIIEEPWIKLLLSGLAKDLHSIESKRLDDELSKKVSWVYSSERYLEFLPKGVSKGNMLNALREEIEESHTIYAVGDYYNDKEMLMEADVGIAMGNAPDDLKEVADLVTVSNDENAIAEIIKTIIKK